MFFKEKEKEKEKLILCHRCYDIRLILIVHKK